MRIPGYFPTPEPLAQELIKIACIKPGHTILEPSAGTGNLIDVVRSLHSGVRVSFCELNCFLLDILRAKYEGLADVHFAGRDCLALDSGELNSFDRIIMNPPFERGDDAEHVLHTFSLLKPGGILAAIVSAGFFARSDKKTQRFRQFLEGTNAVVHDVAAGSFKSSGTGAGIKILCIRSARGSGSDDEAPGRLTLSAAARQEQAPRPQDARAREPGTGGSPAHSRMGACDTSRHSVFATRMRAL